MKAGKRRVAVAVNRVLYDVAIKEKGGFMITESGRIKCDACGKFVSPGDRKTIFAPDSEFTVERLEDYDSKCFIKLQ